VGGDAVALITSTRKAKKKAITACLPKIDLKQLQPQTNGSNTFLLKITYIAFVIVKEFYDKKLNI